MRSEIVGALEELAGINDDGTRREWLLAVARRADPHPVRDRLRQPGLWQDGPALTRLVRELRADELSPRLSTALGRVLILTDGDAVPLLTAAQARDPQDFWLNLELGIALSKARRHDEALGFLRAAPALRPEASMALTSIGVNLYFLGRRAEAIPYFQQAWSSSPTWPSHTGGSGWS